jgi:hypothetical protein
VNPRDVNSISIDHRNLKIKLNPKLQFDSREDELMHIMSKFDFKHLREEQLIFIQNFEKILAEVRESKNKGK